MNVDLSQYGIRQRYAEIAELAERVMDRCQHEVDDLGFAEPSLRLNQPSQASYALERDPASGDYSLVGAWFNNRGLKLGTLVFHADGSFFVEHDVVRPHPGRKQWFVEAVNAWGRDNDIRAEVRLLAMPE
jgi:hypothetical protein